MGKREETRRQADRDFEECRRAVASQTIAWLCDALREIPHRKWIQTEPDVRVAVGVLAHNAAVRLADMERRLQRINAINDNPARFDPEIEQLTAL